MILGDLKTLACRNGNQKNLLAGTCRIRCFVPRDQEGCGGVLGEDLKKMGECL